MMKNFKFMLVALMALFGFNSAFAQLADFNDDAYYYEVQTQNAAQKKATVYISKFNAAPAAEVTLPSTFKKTVSGIEWDITVTGIKAQAVKTDGAFYGQTQITKVTVPSTIQFIGANAFYGCTNLATIDLSGATGLTTIDDQAFVTIQVVNYDFSACTKLVGFPAAGSAFVETGFDSNQYIESMTLPTSTTFKTISTSLAGLPKLATLNISESKIQSVVANAFDGDDLLTAMELPATVKTIATDAFTGSSVADLTINVDAIDAATGIQADVYAAADKATLTKLTLQGTLKGKIAAGAFLNHDLIADGNLVLSDLDFGTNASIEANAFGDLALIESITLGNIGDNGAAVYTIQSNAFNGPLLKSVTIGEITAPQAIAANAFDDGATNTLTSVTIASVKSGGPAIEDGAFNFAAIAADAKATVTIGAVRAQMLGVNIIGNGAFTFTAANAGAAEITIGAIESAGSVFAATPFLNCEFAQGITLTFAGDVEYNGIDQAILDSNADLTALNFNGKVGENGIGANTFNDMHEAAVITFAGSLAELAVAGNAFISAADAPLTVNYTATPDDPSVNPFHQDAFKTGGGTQPLAADADRFITLNITNAELKTLIADGQRSVTDADADDDIIYGVKLINAEEVSNTLVVYQNTGTTNSYGRWFFDAADYPNGIKIARRGHDGVKTLTLYTTYVEDDADHSVVTINMQPIASTDGWYVFDNATLAAFTNGGVVILAKATGTSAEETEIEWYELEGTETPSDLYTDEEVVVANNVVTNQQLRDRTGYDGATALDAAVLDNNDIYFITNPKNHKGISAPTYDYMTASNVYIGEGSFYVIATHYASAPARIVWLDGSDEEATAIQGVKTAAAEGAVYNLAGQKVGAGYKGIVIKEGKKMIQK